MCIDSVRHHLRSGKVEGVGGAWRVPESTLLAQLGLMGVMIAPGVAIEAPEDERAPRVVKVVAVPQRAGTPEQDTGEMDLVATLLATSEARARVLEIVEAAALEAEIGAPSRGRLASEVERRLV